MSDLTVEMVQRGRGPSTEEAARRLGVARDIRSARERLTSRTGLERAFDQELLRHYAQYRAGSGIALGLFAVALAGAEEGEVADVEEPRCYGLLAAALLEIREAAHGEIRVGEEREGERRAAEEGKEGGLELPLVEGPDGEVGAEEGEQKLEARREGEPAREGK